MAGTTTQRRPDAMTGTQTHSTTRNFNLLVDDVEALRAALGGMLSGSATIDPTSLVDAAGATVTITVTGAALGDFAMFSAPYDLQGITATGYVSAANTVAIRLQNESGGTIDLASGTWRARVFPQATFAPVAAASLLAAKVGDGAGVAV